MVITSTDIKGLKKFRTGKVRDVYDLGDELMIVATDRLIEIHEQKIKAKIAEVWGE